MSTRDKVLIGIGGVVAFAAIAAFFMWAGPQYHVYHQGMLGQAKLKEAESSRQIIIQEAHAKMEASRDLAKAEIERAKGVAEANRIIGEGLKGNSEYLTYLWIHSLAERDNATIIYVPTENGLPVLEAGRLSAQRAVQGGAKK